MNSEYSDNAMAKEGQDLALESSGCKVSYASCKHEELASCDNIIDGSKTTFWATTGLYPHHFTLTFPAVVNINGVKIRSYYVKKLVIEKSTKNDTTDFEELKSSDLQLTNLHHQVTELKFNDVSARHLRFHVKEGYEEFCAIYKVQVLGEAASGGDRLSAMPVSYLDGPLRTTSQVSAQLTGRSLASRQPQGMRTMQSVSSAGLGSNGVPMSALLRTPLNPGNQSSLSAQAAAALASTAAGHGNNLQTSVDLNRYPQEDW